MSTAFLKNEVLKSKFYCDEFIQDVQEILEERKSTQLHGEVVMLADYNGVNDVSLFYLNKNELRSGSAIEHDSVSGQPVKKASVAANESFVFLLGEFETKIPCSHFQVYDIEKNVWKMGPSLTTDRDSSALVICYDQLFVIGGRIVNDNAFFSSIEIFRICLDGNLLVDVSYFNLQLLEARGYPAAVSFADNKIYVTGGTRDFSLWNDDIWPELLHDYINSDDDDDDDGMLNDF